MVLKNAVYDELIPRVEVWEPPETTESSIAEIAYILRDINVQSQKVPRPLKEEFEHTADAFAYAEALRGDIHCWHCDYVCKEVIPFVKLEYSCVKIVNYFCTFACMKGYYMSLNLPKHKLNKKLNEINEIFSYRHGVLRSIEEAPSRYVQSKYGGSMTAEEYRDRIRELYDRLIESINEDPESK